MPEYPGTTGDDTIRGGAEDDYIIGDAGNDRLYGGGGNDEIDTGAGDDVAYGGDGDDYVGARDGGHDLIYGEAGNDRLSIDAPDVPTQSGVIDGGAGQDYLSYFGSLDSTGAVTLIGGDGSDWIETTRGGPITINAGAGNDTVSIAETSGATVTLGSGNDVLILSSGLSPASDISVVRVNDFTVGDGGDRIDLRSVFQGVWEDATESTNPFATGNMRVMNVAGGAVVQIREDSSSPFYDVVFLAGVNAGALTAHNFTGADPAGGPLKGYGVYGTEGDDIIGGYELDDVVYGGDGNDSLFGQAGDDRLYGENGNDRLVGRDGSDIMDGGAGDDVFVDGEEYFGQPLTGGDTFIGGTGFDTVVYLQAVTLDVDGSNDTGAAVGDTFTSIEAYEFREGDNRVLGSARNEWFTTGSGADIIDGGAGADVMSGGAGNDRYYVDNRGDQVIEAAGEGHDKVFTSVSFTLGDHIEDLSASGTADVKLVGNDLNNTINGNRGANNISGGAGADVMAGGRGHDNYWVDNVGDQVIELAGEGTDRVYSTVSFTLGANVEKLTLKGEAWINGTGNDLNNTMSGNMGRNVLTGGLGADTLTGKAGSDTFVWTSVEESRAERPDVVTDLNDWSDKIDFRQLDGDVNTAGVQGFDIVDAFSGRAGELVLSYDAATNITALTVDVNGDGQSDMLIHLVGNHESFERFLFGGG